MEDEKSILESSFIKGLRDFIIGQTHVSGIEGLSKNKVIDKDSLSGLILNKVRNINIKNDKLMNTIEYLSEAFDGSLDILQHNFQDKFYKVQSGAFHETKKMIFIK